MGAVSCFWFKGQSSSPLIQWSIPVVQYAAPVQRIHIPEVDGLRAISSNAFNNFLAQDNLTCSASKSMKSAMLQANDIL